MLTLRRAGSGAGRPDGSRLRPTGASTCRWAPRCASPAELKLSIVDLAQVPPGGSPGSAFANSVDLAVAAEHLGYERYWVAEHHGIGGVIANSCPEVIIARIAAA